jgi:hypothetical protein
MTDRDPRSTCCAPADACLCSMGISTPSGDGGFTMPRRRSPDAAARYVLESFVRALAGLDTVPSLGLDDVGDHVRSAAQVTLLTADAAHTLASTSADGRAAHDRQ